MDNIGHLPNRVDDSRVQEELTFSDKPSKSEEHLISNSTQPHPENEDELQKLRKFTMLAEQEVSHYKERAKEALSGFKLAQSRFRQMERERDFQTLAAERSRAKNSELERKVNDTRQEIQQLANLVVLQTEQLDQARIDNQAAQELSDQYNALASQYNFLLSQYTALEEQARWLKKDRELLLANLARFEQDLHNLQATGTVRIISKLGELKKDTLRLIRKTVSRKQENSSK